MPANIKWKVSVVILVGTAATAAAVLYVVRNVPYSRTDM